jgi:hypothetical protein
MTTSTAGPIAELNTFMPLVAVKKALVAAGGQESAPLVEHVSKVELTSERDMSSMCIYIDLKIWWELGPNDHHVHGIRVTLVEGEAFDPMGVLEELLKFEPEDVLKYGAFL